jgi:hypothetical protein
MNWLERFKSWSRSEQFRYLCGLLIYALVTIIVIIGIIALSTHTQCVCPPFETKEIHCGNTCQCVSTEYTEADYPRLCEIANNEVR